MQDTGPPARLPTVDGRRRSSPPAADQVGAVAQRCGAARWARRQRSIRAWSPERSTSGTSQPRNDAGRVNCGSSSRPSAPKLSVHRADAVAHRPGQQPGDGLDHQAGGHLAAAEDDVADAQLAVDEVLAHPVVDALVAPAQQAEPVARRPAARPSRWSKRRPPGPSRSSGRGGSAASTAAKTGWARITIPAPPPNGASSTVRCTSVVCSRRSWVRRSSRPVERALPSRLSAQKRVDQPREDGEHVDAHGVPAYGRDLPRHRRHPLGPLAGRRARTRAPPGTSSSPTRGSSTAATAEQWPGVVERYYAGVPDLLLLHVDERLLVLARRRRAARRRPRAVPSRLRPDRPRRGRRGPDALNGRPMADPSGRLPGGRAAGSRPAGSRRRST